MSLDEQKSKDNQQPIVKCNNQRREVQLLNIGNDRKSQKTYTFDQV